MEHYGVTKNQFIERIMSREDNKYYRREAVREIIDMYNNEMQKALMNGERITISKIGTIVPTIRYKETSFVLPSHPDGNYETLPFVNFHINRNKIFKDSLNNKLRNNLIKNGKLELSENMPPLSDTMKEWETKYVEAHK